MDSSARGAAPWAVAARDLFLVAMAVFVVNIVIGILNGADAVEFDHNQILTHVHAGTVGWLTLTIVASTFLLFRAADRRLMLALALLVPVYVLAFYTGNLAFRAIGGTALLVAIAWLLWWTWQQYLGGERSLPRLAVTLGLSTFGYGAVIGVLLQLQGALAITILSGDSVGAHAGAMTFGYVVLCAMGFIEWRVLGTRDLPRSGVVQVVALFAGGLIISISLLAGAAQVGGGIYLLTQIVAIVAFVARIWPTALRVAWLRADPARHLSAAAVWVVAALILFMYIVYTFIQDPTAVDALPINILIASDHAVYIGVITNIVLALLSLLVLSEADRRGWIGHVIFWGVNLGLVVFAFGLIVDTAEIKRIGAPVMGVTLLVALAILAMRAVGARLDTASLED
ncbi:MAG: hypothetical protein WEG56_05015 [Chloroflexota bacterium]